MIALAAGLGLLACYVAVIVGYRWYQYGGPEISFDRGVVIEHTEKRPPVLDRFADWCADRFAGVVLRRMGPTRVQRIRQMLERAGRPNGMTTEAYAGRKVSLTIVGLGLGLVFLLSGRWIIATGVVLGGWFLTDIGLRTEARKRQRQMELDMPDFLDIFAVSVRAGVSFRGAVARVAESVPGPLAEEMLTTLHKIDLGESRRSALNELRDRNDSEMLSRFVASLLQSEELGTPLADTLRQIAIEMRRDAAAAALQRASKAAPRVSLVVTLVILPAAMLVMVTGLLITTEFNVEFFRG